MKQTIATKSDFRVETMRGSGPGGQKRNKTDSAVRITHLPTGMNEYCCDTPSQGRNKATAFRKLAMRVAAVMTEADKPTERYAAGNKVIRTYHEPDDRVTDASHDKQFSYRRTVGKGAIGDILESRRTAMLEKEANGE